MRGPAPCTPGIYRFGFRRGPPTGIQRYPCLAAVFIQSIISHRKRGDAVWFRPSQTRYGAHVASQRCTILRSGKAIILCRNTQLMATPKTQIVLDMGYTLDVYLPTQTTEDSFSYTSLERKIKIYFPSFLFYQRLVKFTFSFLSK